MLHALGAANEAMEHNNLHLRLPVVGEVQFPAAAEELAFIGGVAALAIVGFVEWPVAILLGIGHSLATNRRNKTVQAFGAALEEA